jgi:hypothetical protein
MGEKLKDGKRCIVIWVALGLSYQQEAAERGMQHARY